MLTVSTPNGHRVIRTADLSPKPAVQALWGELQGKMPLTVSILLQREADRFVDFLLGKRGFQYELLSPSLVFLVDYNKMHQYLEEEEVPMVTVRLTDAKALMVRDEVKRYYHFFDDFLTENPECSVVPLPMTYSQLSAIHCGSSLAYCYDELKFLNPKSNLDYCSFSLRGMTREQLVELAQRLTPSEKSSLLAYARREGYSPEEQDGLPLLTCFGGVRRDVNLLRLIYPGRPSYVMSLLLQEDHKWVLDRLVDCLDGSFEEDQDAVDVPVSVVCSKLSELFLILLEGDSRFCPMVEPGYTRLPYGIDLGSSTYGPKLREVAEAAKTGRTRTKTVNL